jgi:hypothetical protein
MKITVKELRRMIAEAGGLSRFPAQGSGHDRLFTTVERAEVMIDGDVNDPSNPHPFAYVVLKSGEGYSSGSLRILKDVFAKIDREIRTNGKCIANVAPYINNDDMVFVWLDGMPEPDESMFDMDAPLAGAGSMSKNTSPNVWSYEWWK